MLDHALEAIELAGELTTDEIKADRKLELALTRLVEIIVKQPAVSRSTRPAGQGRFHGRRSSACAID
jgi:hypothetical protein